MLVTTAAIYCHPKWHLCGSLRVHIHLCGTLTEQVVFLLLKYWLRSWIYDVLELMPLQYMYHLIHQN